MLNKKIICVFMSATMLFSLSACSKETEQADNSTSDGQSQIVAARNDWYGGISRISKIRNDAVSVVSVLDNHNYDIISGNPQDYWSDDYFFLNFNPMDSDYIKYTVYLNEQESWDVISNNITTILANEGKENIYMNKIEPNRYCITWGAFGSLVPVGVTNAHLTIQLDCTYDPNHNWLQMIETSNAYSYGKFCEDEFYEYAELDKYHYVIQNEKERLYISYKENGDIESLYYSILGNNDRVYSPYKSNVDAETLLNTDETEVDESEQTDIEKTAEESNIEEEVTEHVFYGGYSSHYNHVDDTIFERIDDITSDWVVEEPTVDQYVVYKNHVLSFKVFNKLSHKYEGFTITDSPKEPVLDAETGIYYDPVSGKQTTMEEYQQILKEINQELIDIENEEKEEKTSESDISEVQPEIESETEGEEEKPDNDWTQDVLDLFTACNQNLTEKEALSEDDMKIISILTKISGGDKLTEKDDTDIICNWLKTYTSEENQPSGDIWNGYYFLYHNHVQQSYPDEPAECFESADSFYNECFYLCLTDFIGFSEVSPEIQSFWINSVS